VNLHGSLVDSEVAGDLLVESALQHQPEDLALARADRLEALANLVLAGALGALAGIARQRPLHRIEQVLLGGALLQEVFGAAAHRLHRRGGVGMAGEEEQRQRGGGPGECGLQVEPADFRASAGRPRRSRAHPLRARRGSRSPTRRS
jgi:hypothetical protein